MNGQLESNEGLMSVLQAELREFSERKQMVSNAVNDIAHAHEDRLNSLKNHIREQIEAIKKMSAVEESALENFLKEDRGNLNELKKLGTINTGMTSLEKETKSQNDKLDHLNISLETLAEKLDKPSKPALDMPEVMKYAIYVFISTGALLGVGACFWTIYTVFS